MNIYGDGDTMSDNKTAYSGKDYPVHTNGPWRIEGDQIRTSIASGVKHIAMVNYFNCGTGDPRTITDEEHEANVKLIAAAPEMLEALRRVDNYFTQPGEDDWIRFCKDALEPVRRAIKLAMEG